MYDFHNNYIIKTKYANDAKLLFYQDMAQDIHLFYTSDYPTSHPLHSTTNKKVLGKMKDKAADIAIEEFVGLRPKMYSFLYSENNN